MRKVVILGWDCVPPKLAFHDLIDKMPNLKKLLQHSIYGPLRTIKPPITIPAWMCMMTGCDPGQLGLYGFRHRKPGNYERIWVPNSTTIKIPKIWDIIGNSGGRVIVVGIPPTYPPQEVDGIVISGFITPDTNHTYTYPESFKDTITVCRRSKSTREKLPTF